jgi:molybdopterin-synthase adenylyltransferase
VEKIFSSSPTSIKLFAERIEGALDRHNGIAGFDQEKYSRSHVLCIGAGGLISNIAPTLCRKGIGKLTVLDDDVVEVSNLNRQRFYPKDIGKNKALALVVNLQQECTFSTELTGYAIRLEEALDGGTPLECDIAICGVDNNPARTTASRFFRAKGIPVIFTAVSADADHGYVFIQEATGPCFGCLFPDSVHDNRYPCPGTPAMVDVLQSMGALATYAVDAVLLQRARTWNWFRLSISGRNPIFTSQIALRHDCPLSVSHNDTPSQLQPERRYT